MVFCGFKADLKARKQCNEFTRFYSTKHFCDRCDAVQVTVKPFPYDRMSYKDFMRNPCYTETSIDHDKYAGGRKLSPWLELVDGWQLESCRFDMMHVVYLGIARNTFPSCLKMLQVLKHPYAEGLSDEDFLKKFTIEMRKVGKQHGPLDLSEFSHI